MKKVIVLVIVVVLWLIAFFSAPIGTIDSTQRGIVYQLWEVQDTVLAPWFYMLFPFINTVKKVSITPQTVEVNIPVWAQGSITKDNQTIGTDLMVFYRYKATELTNAARNYGFELLKQKVVKDVTEAFKQTIGTYTIFDVAQKQEEIRTKFIEAVKAKVGDYPLFIDDIKVSNYDWSDEFDAQIALTMKIAQESKQQEQELKKIEISAQQQVVQAKANKEAAALNAEAKELEGKGIAAYNEAITQDPKNMTLQITLKQLEIEKILAEKRNGVRVPANNYWPIPVFTQSEVK